MSFLSLSSEKMCKDRITRWGFRKTIKKSEYKAIIRDMDGAPGWMRQGRLWIRGKEVKKRDVKRYLKRRKTSNEYSIDGGRDMNISGAHGWKVMATSKVVMSWYKYHFMIILSASSSLKIFKSNTLERKKGRYLFLSRDFISQRLKHCMLYIS